MYASLKSSHFVRIYSYEVHMHVHSRLFLGCHGYRVGWSMTPPPRLCAGFARPRATGFSIQVSQTARARWTVLDMRLGLFLSSSSRLDGSPEFHVHHSRPFFERLHTTEDRETTLVGLQPQILSCCLDVAICNSHSGCLCNSTPLITFPLSGCIWVCLSSFQSESPVFLSSVTPMDWQACGGEQHQTMELLTVALEQTFYYHDVRNEIITLKHHVFMLLNRMFLSIPFNAYLPPTHHDIIINLIVRLVFSAPSPIDVALFVFCSWIRSKNDNCSEFAFGNMLQFAV